MTCHLLKIQLRYRPSENLALIAMKLLCFEAVGMKYQTTLNQLDNLSS